MDGYVDSKKVNTRNAVRLFPTMLVVSAIAMAMAMPAFAASADDDSGLRPAATTPITITVNIFADCSVVSAGFAGKWKLQEYNLGNGSWQDRGPWRDPGTSAVANVDSGDFRVVYGNASGYITPPISTSFGKSAPSVVREGYYIPSGGSNAVVVNSFNAASTNITLGQSTTLNWDTCNGEEIYIETVDGNSGNDFDKLTPVKNGSLTVTPSVTTTYKLFVESAFAGSSWHEHPTTVTVNVSSQPTTYDVTHVEGANGSISGTKVQTVNAGANSTSVTAVPDAGYKFVNWTGNTGTINPNANTATINFNNVQNDITVTANFARKLGNLKIVTKTNDNSDLQKGSGWELGNRPGDFVDFTKFTVFSTDPSPQITNYSQKPIGTYEVKGNDVDGWNVAVSVSGGGPPPAPGAAPSASSAQGELQEGGTLEFTVTYTRQMGNWKIITKTSDGRDLPISSGWSTSTKPDGFAGLAKIYAGGGSSPQTVGPSPVPTGTYGITPRDKDGWTESVSVSGGTSPGGAPAVLAPNEGVLEEGGTLEFTVTYTRLVGTLNVELDPLNKGAKFTINGPPDFNGGNPLVDQTTNFSGSVPITGINEEYEVTFSTVSGYELQVSGDYGTSNPANGPLGEGETKNVKGTYTRNFGRLEVNIDPEDIGAEFVIDGPDDFNSGLNFIGTADYAADVPAGSYKVTFSTVTGYSLAVSGNLGGFTGTSSEGSVGRDETKTVNGDYTRQVGTLKINIINGSQADYPNLPAEAGWNITSSADGYGGPTTGTSNLNDTAAPTGDYTIEGKPVTGWSFDVTSVEPSVAPSAASKSGRVYESSDTTFTVTYTRQTGLLIVEIENLSSPDYTLPGAAGWTMISSPDGYAGQTQGSDASYSLPDAPAGEYRLSGNEIPGWRIDYRNGQGPIQTAPSARTGGGRIYDQDIQLRITVDYERLTGILLVETRTSDRSALPVGAGWELTTHPADYLGLTSKSYVGGEINPPSHIDLFAASGDYALTGKPVVGWTSDVTVLQQDLDDDVAPSAETESGEIIDSDTTLNFTVIYTINRYDVGAVYWDPVNNVEVPGGTITPSGAGVEHGGSLAFTATTPPTNYQLLGTASYTGTSLGAAMAANVATVSGIGSDGTVRIDVELALGELEVIILPESIRPQAGWKFQGGGAYKLSSPNPAGTEALINGFYDLEFKDVDGWFTPAALKDIQILPNQKRVVQVVYTEDPAGSLQVFIEDNFDERVNDLGAQWQPVFPAGSSIGTMLADTWYNSGDIIAGIEPGDVGIRFKTLAGWVLPELGGATVVANKTTRETGEYYRVLVIHKSDYNGDGTDDLATFDKNSATWSVASIGKPAAIPSAVDLFETKFGRSDDIPTAGDYDGDGVADLAYWREGTGEWRVSRQFKLKNFGQAQDIPVPGDYNGDGMTDPALFRPSTGEWMIYNAETKKTTKVSFGAFGDVPVPGNYDADEGGMTDLAVFNVETRKWRVAIYDANKNAWVEKKKVKVNGKRIKLNDNHGAVGNVPVHADYDGDGATDFAVYRRGSSEWDIRGTDVIQLGVRGDVPVPNDWAGLGRVIPTIFHPKNGRWVAIDNLLRTKHGRGGQPLMSGR